MFAVAGACGSQKISRSASRCRASARVRAIATRPIGWAPAVLNPASYSSVLLVRVCVPVGVTGAAARPADLVSIHLNRSVP